VNSSPEGPSDEFVDKGFDGQHQYITDRHRFSAQASWIRESQHWDATFPGGGASNPADHLRTFKIKATYYRDAKYGATLGYFSTSGNSDPSLYATGLPITGSAAASPDASGYVTELDWLPKRDVRLGLQYTAYRQFNGASSNYHGLGRNAKDNNTLFLMAWLMF
jgi:hypothetical protein